MKSIDGVPTRPQLEAGATNQSAQPMSADGQVARPEHTEQSVAFPGHPELIDAAERAATLRIFEATTAAHLAAVTSAVTEAQQITDASVVRYHAPFMEEAIRRIGRRLLVQEEAAMNHVERIAHAYRSRIHV